MSALPLGGNPPPYSCMDFQEMWGSWVRAKGSGRVLGSELSGHLSLRCPLGAGGRDVIISSSQIRRLRFDAE